MKKKDSSAAWSIINTFFGILFLVNGVLNLIFVHIVPGVVYLFIALFYFPFTDSLLKQHFGIRIMPILKIVTALIILWGTLAIGDLMEMIEAGDLLSS